MNDTDCLPTFCNVLPMIVDFYVDNTVACLCNKSGTVSSLAMLPFKANIKAISRYTRQLQCIKLHHCLLEILNRSSDLVVIN